MFSFIILHYKNISETLNCLYKLQAFKNNDCNFIVVDNNSLSLEEEKEIKEYTEDIVKLNKNYGFAKANNKGIKYAKNKYNSKFYIVINNDVEITQENFLQLIIDDYDKYQFDMLGPWIDTPGNSVNPFNAYTTKEQIEYEINKCKKIINICNSGIKYYLLMLGVKIKSIFKKNRKPVNENKLKEGVALHGCAIIFSDKYVKKYDYPFYNDTFLFHEEDFLYQRVLKDKLITVYDPNLKVYHKEGSTMGVINKNARMKRKFREEERLKSLELLLKEM